MSQQFLSTMKVPEETARLARAIHPDGNLAMAIRDQLYCVYDDVMFSRLYPDKGQGAESAWRLALVLVLQHVEHLSDRQAAEAVRDRISWKYLLGLELSERGFDASVLSEFRTRLLEGEAEYKLLNALLDWLQQVGLIKSRGRMRTDASHVLGHLRMLNRLTLVGETVRAALNALSSAASDWLRAQVNVTWYERYGRRVEDYRLPNTETEREALAQSIGEDGQYLLNRLAQGDAPASSQHLPAVDVLRQVWAQQYDLSQGGQIRWRVTQDLPPAADLIQSPYEREARFARKNETTAWSGYKLHVTECCDDDSPRLITHVHTTPATTPDEQALEPIHAALQAKDLLPNQHIVDEGYMDSIQLVNSQTEYGVQLVGPFPVNTTWQARAKQGFASEDFRIDWQAQTVTCPAGQTSANWQPYTDSRGQPGFRVRFSRPVCRACPLRQQCTHSATGPRLVTFRTQERVLAQQAARQFQASPDFKPTYADRAGIEATFSQELNIADLRHARYRGLRKTRLSHILTAVAVNLIRVIAWLRDVPLAPTRQSPFAALAQPS